MASQGFTDMTVTFTKDNCSGSSVKWVPAYSYVDEYIYISWGSAYWSDSCTFAV